MAADSGLDPRKIDWRGAPDCAGKPRLAKDAAYAEAVAAAWAEDPDILGGEDGPCTAAPLVYDDCGLALHGRLVQPARKNGAGVVLVHTAVGPHDLFLYWKAEALASAGYTVLIADMLGDESGLGWEPAWSSGARQPLADDRELNRRRARAAVTALSRVPGVQAERLGALGFCFGGRAVIDLARLGACSGVAAVVSFHGILDNGVVPAADMSGPEAPHVLICHGDADPFIPAEDRAACEAQLRGSSARWDLMVFGGARHGFTNPAQDFNGNPAFGFDCRAAGESWAAAKRLLQRCLLS